MMTWAMTLASAIAVKIDEGIDPSFRFEPGGGHPLADKSHIMPKQGHVAIGQTRAGSVP